MPSPRSLLALLVVLCAFGAAVGSAGLLVCWFVKPSQAIVELTRYAYSWAGGAAWLLALLGLPATRGRTRRATVASLVVGAALGVALWLGPGSVEAQCDVVVENHSGGPLADVRVTVGADRHHAPELADGAVWCFPLRSDTHGALRFRATDAAGEMVSARSSVIAGEPDRFRIRIGRDGSVALTSRMMRTRLSPYWR